MIFHVSIILFVNDFFFSNICKRFLKKRFHTLIPLGVWIVLISNINVEDKIQQNVKKEHDSKAIGPYQSTIVNGRQMYEQNKCIIFLVVSHIISHHHPNIIHKIIFKPKLKSFPSSMKEGI